MSPGDAHKRLRKSYRARWNRMRAEAAAIAELMQGPDPDKAGGDLVQELRDRAENLLQSMHEFSAYRNAAAAVLGSAEGES